jgi:hypothetical protein
MHGYSTLDKDRPGDPRLLIASAAQMAQWLRAKNAAVQLRLLATWPRADQVYDPKGAWYGKSVEDMAQDLRAAYDLAAARIRAPQSVVPVGEAWIRSIHSGFAQSNPYDGSDAGKVDLWAEDGYHASVFGYYLSALMVFGSVTGFDPRALGDNESSGFELGMSPMQVRALQRVAYEQLAAAGALADPIRASHPR